MKQFIKDCMLFKHSDNEMRFIGVLAWICLAGWVYYIFEYLI